jgi:uncharacterized membrane protein
MMELLRDALRVVHVLAVVYWLGADAVVFYLGFGARDRSAPVAIRQERLRIMRVVDRYVVIAFRTVYVTGLLMLLLLDFGPVQAGWFQVKLVLTVLIFLAGLQLARVGALGSLGAALAAGAAGDPRAGALEEEAWRRRIPSRAYVLVIYALGIAVLALAIMMHS